jgi:hypothetical protein
MLGWLRMLWRDLWRGPGPHDVPVIPRLITPPRHEPWPPRVPRQFTYEDRQ